MDEAFRKKLQEVAGEAAVRTDSEALEVFEASGQAVPEAVVRVHSPGEASGVVNEANGRGVPFAVADRAGSICGPGSDCRSFIALDISGMDRVKEKSHLDLFVSAEPGVMLSDLDIALDPANSFFPPDPVEGRSCSLGRVVLTNPIHPGVEKYGMCRDYVLGMEAVTPVGESVKLGARTLKNSSGMQIERFLSGSGGLLSVPTLVTLQIRPGQGSVQLLKAGFNSVSNGLRAVDDIASSPVVPSSLEIMNPAWSRLCDESLELKGVALLVFAELAGHEQAVKVESRQVERLLIDNRAVDVRGTSDRASVEDSREARRRMVSLDRARKGDLLTFQVVLDRAMEAIQTVEEVSVRSGVKTATYAYYVLGKFHVSVAIENESPSAFGNPLAEAKDKILALGGTGVSVQSRGTTGLDSLGGAYSGRDAISAALKRELDPGYIMNLCGSSPTTGVQKEDFGVSCEC
jgi:glycolate oxidase